MPAASIDEEWRRKRPQASEASEARPAVRLRPAVAEKRSAPETSVEEHAEAQEAPETGGGRNYMDPAPAEDEAKRARVTAVVAALRAEAACSKEPDEERYPDEDAERKGMHAELHNLELRGA